MAKCPIAKASEKLKPMLEKIATLKKLNEDELESLSLKKLRDEFEAKAGISPIPEFGTNYAEYYHDGVGAVNKLLAEKKGQVVGAFYRDDLGDIDLVWGDEKIGLNKIIEKHKADFDKFGGVDKGLSEIIKRGVVIERGGVYSVWLKNGDDYYVAGLSKGWKNQGENKWLITAYKKTKGEIPKEISAGDSLNLFASAKFNELQTSSSTNPKTISQKAEQVKQELGDELNQIKEQINQAKGFKDKYQTGVEAVFKAMENLKDKATIKLAKTDLKYAGISLNKLASLREFGRELDDIASSFRVAKSAIYEKANEIKEALAHLSDDDSKALFKALDGTLEPNKLNSNLKPFYEKFRADIDENANKLIKLGALDSKYKIKDYIKHYYTKAIDEKRASAKLAFDSLHARKDLSEDERLALGLLEDADFAIANTIAEQDLQILRAKTLKDFADTFGRDEALNKDWVRVSDESVGGGVKKYGALAGKWVAPEVYSALKSADLLGAEMNIFNNWYFRLVDHIKVNVTVKNPFTHLYNMGSNFILAFLHGDEAALAKVFTMMARDKEGFKDLVSKARKLGLNSNLEEMSALGALKGKQDDSLMLKIIKNLYLSEDSKAGKWARRAYAFEDEIFKLARFKKNLDAGMSPEVAMRDAQWAYVDYGTHFNGTLRLLDKSGVMPFLHYAVKSTPVVLRAIARNPHRFLALQLGLSMAGASSFISDNQRENLNKPHWAQSGDMPNMFGVKSWVKLWDGWYLNAGRLVPGFRFDGFDSLELGGGFVKGVLNIAGGKTALGYSFESENDTVLKRLGKRGLELSKSYFPPLFPAGRYGQQLIQTGLSKITDSAEPVKDYNEDELGTAGIIARGAGIRRFNSQKHLNQANNKAIKQLKEAKDKKDKEKETELLKRLRLIKDEASRQRVNLKMDYLRG